MSTDEGLLRMLVASARSGRGASGGAQLDGVFKRMLEPAEFRKLVYPGLAPAQRDAAPKSLQEVLCDPQHAQAVQQMVPRARERAQKVLDAVKKRGAAEGDVMDADTEASLWPDVFQEAFGREIISVVTLAAATAHATLVCFQPNDVCCLFPCAYPASHSLGAHALCRVWTPSLQAGIVPV
jgi:hypothetical protein